MASLVSSGYASSSASTSGRHNCISGLGNSCIFYLRRKRFHPQVSRESQSSVSTSTPQATVVNSDTQTRTKAVEVPFHPVDASIYDLDVRHYKVPMLRFFNPLMVVSSGAAFIIMANMMHENGPSMETTVIACVPVLLWYFIFLHVLPAGFKDFAVRYMETHDFVPSASVDELQERKQ
ncbi:hypothetical protein CEUSTIGMA_g6721.t1 [Chlamydomonas eustigma]|uniref:Uncharacterized protein n=1 Tax=Chlamydomonas eustigma TaxID=1157962 RepID=A0A250X873_9CHLO|nr:hypothetical protein CEUSTIGMA_g6721.t1 [Chlamydomonas eustigma]|eukprot:GAX79281.1 hypothetical protein CEUSTIGMA_g6721.t1 [Chlamydomonas eustigma]